MSDPVLEAVRRARSESTPIPKSLMLDRMSHNIKVLQSTADVDPALIDLAVEALRDLESLMTEEDVTRCVQKWIDISSKVSVQERPFASGLGSLLLRVEV